jgi:dipeptidyl aminopeptidase/acylaminoacyl peptidase
MNPSQPNYGEIRHIVKLVSPDSSMRVMEISYISSEGLLVKGCLVHPLEGGPWRPLLYLRGGIRSVGMVRIPRMITLAKRGYAVFAPYYRGNNGGEGREDFAGEDRYDAYNALHVFEQLQVTLPVPVSVLGFSRGAIMALLMARDCHLVGPVAVWGGVSDLWLTYEERVDLRRMLRRVVGHPRKQLEAYLSRSPVCWATYIRSPIFIVHGIEDEKVGIEHAYRLRSALTSAGRPPLTHLVEGMQHAFSPEEDKKTLDLLFAWYESCHQ